MSSSGDHRPIRTCVACKSKMEKSSLIRLALDERARVIIDNRGKEKGRGVYICHKESCMKKLSENRKLNRLFRVDAPVRIGF